jgi:putative heme iron utilization protein
MIMADCRTWSERIMADDDYDPLWVARQLLRAARVGTLATTDKGHPFASLVTPACMPDGSLAMLISRLSEHTRHLEADPRCSILVTGTPETVNPQTAPRATVIGVAEAVNDRALKARFLTIHPYASLYAGFGDFSFWRLKPAAVRLVGGFGRAYRLKGSDVAPDPEAMAAVLAAEAGVLEHCNRDHAPALASIAGSPGDWRMVAVDVDGFDLALEEKVIRIPWSTPVKDAAEIRQELVRMVQDGAAVHTHTN